MNIRDEIAAVLEIVVLDDDAISLALKDGRYFGRDGSHRAAPTHQELERISRGVLHGPMALPVLLRCIIAERAAD
jgi:hypothetical protein